MNGARSMAKILNIALMAIAVCAATAAEQQPDIEKARLQYREGMLAIEAKAAKARTALISAYTNDLEAIRARAQQAGDLAKLKAVMAEAARAAGAQTLPDACPDVPEINPIVGEYGARLRDLDLRRAKEIAELAGEYDKRLEALQRRLTQEGKIEEATAVQDERNVAAEAEPVKTARALVAEQQAAQQAKSAATPAVASGIPLAQGTPTSGFAAVGVFTNGAKAYSNRNYVWLDIPSKLGASRFVMIAGGAQEQICLKVTKAGRMLLGVSEQIAESDKDYLRNNHWKQTDSEFFYSTNPIKTRMFVFEKQVLPGQLVLPRLGWGSPIVLLP